MSHSMTSITSLLRSLAKQNEISNMSGGKSLDLELSFFSDVTHLSPVVDTQRMSVTATANLINNDAPSSGVGDENLFYTS